MLTSLLDFWNDRLLRLALLCILLMGAAVASIHPFQSAIGIERLGFTAAGYAVVTSLGGVLSMAASVWVGVYSDQTGRYREVLIAAILAGVLAGACMFFLPSKASFVVVHMVLFPISATAFTQYFALASLAAQANDALNKDLSLSMIRAGFAISFAVTPPIWAVIVGYGADLIWVYAVIGAINLAVLGIVFSQWPRDGNGPTPKKSGISFLDSLAELAAPSVLIRLILIAVIIGCNALYNILLGLLILNSLQGTESDIGWFAGAVALVEVPVMLASAWVIRKLTKTGAIFLGTMIYVAFLGRLGFMPSMQAAWWLILPAGIGAGLLLSITVGYVQDLVSHRAGAGSALVSVGHFGGTIFASVVFAVGTYWFDYAGTALLGCSLTFLAGVTLLWLDWGQLRQRTV